MGSEGFYLSDRLALRPKEAAKTLGISERALRSLLPELPVVRRGRIVLLPVQALQAWLLEQARVEPERAGAVADAIIAEIRNDHR